MDVEQCLMADEVAVLTGFSRAHVYRHYVDFGGYRVGRGKRFRAAFVYGLIRHPQSNDPGDAGDVGRGLTREVDPRQ